jgi:hypothetical protein
VCLGTPFTALAEQAAGTGNVLSPVAVHIELRACTPATAQSSRSLATALVTFDPPTSGWGANRRELQLSVQGQATLAGPVRWPAESLRAAGPKGVCVAFSHLSPGEGQLIARLVEVSPGGQVLWAPTDTLFLLLTPQGQLLASKSSPFELWRLWLQHEKSAGRLTAGDFERLQQRLIEQGRLHFGVR